MFGRREDLVEVDAAIGFLAVYETRRGSGLFLATARSRSVFMYSRTFSRRGRSGPGSGWPSSVCSANSRSIQASKRSRSAAVGCGWLDGGICRVRSRSQISSKSCGFSCP